MAKEAKAKVEQWLGLMGPEAIDKNKQPPGSIGWYQRY